MKANKKFIRNWEKNRKKGKTRYIVSHLLTFAAVSWVLTIVINLIKGHGFSKVFDFIDTFIAASVGVLIGTYISWNINESKYNKMKG